MTTNSPAAAGATAARLSEPTPIATFKSLAAGLGVAERVPHSLLALMARVAVATVFWRSGQTKVAGWEISESTYDLFRDEYKVPLLPPELAAYLATIGEHLFAALLVIGLASRLSALGLLAMTAVIQIFVYPTSWPDHLLWASLLLTLIARGPGVFSVDHFLRRRFLDQA